MEKAQSESYLSITSSDIKINLRKDFLEELQNNTYQGWIDEDVIDHIAKVLKIVDLIRVSGTDSHQLRMKIFPLSLTDEARQWWIDEGEGKITVWKELAEKYFSWERFKELLMKCPQHYLIEMQEVILFYNGLDVPTRQILDLRGRSTKTSDGLAAIQAQLNNHGREIKKVNEKVYAAQVGCEQCKGPHYTKDWPQKEEGKTLEEAYYTQFGGPF
ncbi:hypothetical protein Tco_1399725 [Tanacetum coccineum]